MQLTSKAHSELVQILMTAFYHKHRGLFDDKTKFEVAQMNYMTQVLAMTPQQQIHEINAASLSKGLTKKLTQMV